MAPCISRTVLEPKADHILEQKKEEFSGEIEGGILWQALKVEENVIKNILLHLDAVDLINLEKTCVLMRKLIVQNSVWKHKLRNDFSNMLSNYVIIDKIDLVVTEADKKHNGDVVKNDNWSHKLKYVHCWNLKLNWDKGQFLQSRITIPQPPIETIDDSDDSDDEIDYGMETMCLISTGFSEIIGYHEPGNLFCHKNKTVIDMGFTGILNVIEVSPKSQVIIGMVSTHVANCCAKLVEKKSLNVLSEEEFEIVDLNHWFHTSISVLGDRIIWCNEVCEIEVFNFHDDPPYIGHVKYNPMELQLLSLPTVGTINNSGLNIEFSGEYSIIVNKFKLDLLKADFGNVAQQKKLYQRVWGLDISNQTSLPEVKFSSAVIDFPFIYAGKSNGILEVWDVTRNEIVKTVNLADRKDYRQGLPKDCPCPGDVCQAPYTSRNGIVTIRLNEIGKVCIVNRSHDIFVIDATLLKSNTDSPLLGYRMLRDDESWDMEVDSTCIVVCQGHLGEVKFDFWPIFPANFKLKQVEPEDGGKELPFKRADYLCSAGVKKPRDGDELEANAGETYFIFHFMNNV